jgi:hypothetical protein
MQPPSILCAAMGGLAAVVLAGARDLSGLAKRNPFADAPAAKPAEAAPVTQWELRGVVREKDGYLLNVYDVQSRKSYWVQSGAKIGAAVIGAYDLSTGTLELETGERRLALALKMAGPRALAGGNSARMVALSSSATGPVQVRVQAAVAVAPPDSEVRRMEELAQLIRQRREQREKEPGTASLSKT